MNVATAVEEAALNADFFDEKGLLKEYQMKQMRVLSGRSTDKPIMIESTYADIFQGLGKFPLDPYKLRL